MYTRRNGSGAQVGPTVENQGVPPELAIAGLAEVHPYPLVSMGRDGNGHWRGTRRVPAPVVWPHYPHVQHDTGSSFTGLWFDVDVPGAVEAAVDAGKVPAPSVLITRKSNRHSAVGYLLVRPVHSYPGARPGPLQLYRAVKAYFRYALQADPGYTGTLFRNAVVAEQDPRFDVEMRPGGYSLAELADWIMPGWCMPPRMPAEPPGRNCAMFADLMYQAGRKVVPDEALWALAAEINENFARPLSEIEVGHIVKHVLKCRWRWRDAGWHSRAFLAKQAARGRRGGLRSGRVRRARAAERSDKAIALAQQGATRKEIGERLGVSRTTVWRYLNQCFTKPTPDSRHYPTAGGGAVGGARGAAAPIDSDTASRKEAPSPMIGSPASGREHANAARPCAMLSPSPLHGGSTSTNPRLRSRRANATGMQDGLPPRKRWRWRGAAEES